MGTFYVMGHKLELLKLSTLKDMKERRKRYDRRYSQEAIREKAKEDASLGVPASSDEQAAPYESELSTAANKLASHIVGIYRGALELLDAKIKTEKELLEQSYQDARGNIERLHDLEESAVENAHSLKDAHRHLERVEKRYNKYSDRLGRGPIQYIPHWLYVVFALLIFLGEIPLNALVFQIFGENQVMTWVMAFIIGLSIPLVAHFVGIKAREHGDSLNWGNLFKAILGTGVIVAALYGLSVMRQVYLKAYQNELGLTEELVETSFLFFWLNIAVFFAAVMIAYLSHDPEPGYEAVEKEFRKIRKRVETLERKRIALLRKIGLERQQALKKTNSEFRQGMSRVHMMYGAYDQLLRDGQEHEHRCLERLKRQVSMYRDENLKHRPDKERPKSFLVQPQFELKLTHIKEKLINEDFGLPQLKADPTT